MNLETLRYLNEYHFRENAIIFLDKSSKNRYATRSGKKIELAFEIYHDLFYSTRDLSLFEKNGLKC